MGGPLTVKSHGSGDVRWIFPGLRRLDPKVFGTPAAPLGFEPNVGVPVSQRLTNSDGTAWTTTAGPMPFSDNFAQIKGKYSLKAVDATLSNDPHSDDSVKFFAKFKSPDGNNVYTVHVDRVIKNGPIFNMFGGVGTNMQHHGKTGLGPKVMPTAPTQVAFWGVGTLKLNGAVVAENRLVHLMATCNVRDAEYKLVFEDGVDCTKVHSHLMLPPIEITPNGPASSPLPTGFILPDGVEQPFLHIMFEEIEIYSVKGDHRKKKKPYPYYKKLRTSGKSH